MSEIRYIIIEDERLSASFLEEMVASLRPSWKFCGQAGSLARARALIDSVKPGLIFMDVELSDGNCFDIVNSGEIDVPMIFTTAYDKYAVKAFKMPGVDYLLKPVDKDELESAILKFEKTQPRDRAFLDNNKILIDAGSSYILVDISEVALFSSKDKYTYLHTFTGRSYVVDKSLDSLESVLSADFFRISRSVIVNINSIAEIEKHYDGHKLSVRLKIQIPEYAQVAVSSARKGAFLRWVGTMM